MIYLSVIVAACLVIATVHDILKRDDVDYAGLAKEYWKPVVATIVVGVGLWALIEIIS